MEQKVRGLLNVHQVAELTGWRESTVRQKVLYREIEYVKLGRNVRFRPEVIDDLIQRGIVPPLAERK